MAYGTVVGRWPYSSPTAALGLAVRSSGKKVCGKQSVCGGYGGKIGKVMCRLTHTPREKWRGYPFLAFVPIRNYVLHG